jgi:hypothetical protein
VLSPDLGVLAKGFTLLVCSTFAFDSVSNVRL